MPEDPYRDQLEAAHRRITALEQELHQNASGARALPVPLQGKLREGERLLWFGHPGQAQGTSWARGIISALALVGGGIFMLRGGPALIPWMLGSFGAVLGTSVLFSLSRRLSARGDYYALTDRRLFLENKGNRVVVELEQCGTPTLLMGPGRSSSLRIPLGEGDGQSLTLRDVTDPEMVKGLLDQARVLLLPPGKDIAFDAAESGAVEGGRRDF